MGASEFGDAMLRACGGRTVQLRVAQPPVAGDASEELGLVAPAFQDAEIGPAVFRNGGTTSVLVVSATAVEALAGTLGVASAMSVLQSAAGVLVDGAVFRIAGAVAEMRGEAAACYALTLTTAGEGE